MATPKIIADFETSLSTPISVGSTSFTLASATDDDGVALPTGKYYLTVDNASNQKEYFVGTVTGTSVTSVSSVSRQGVETVGAVRSHRVGASVIMTDFMTYKNYIDETTTAGAPDASNTTKGVVEIATLAEFRARTGTGSTGAKLAISPDLADDLPTQNEKLAMAGTGAFGTPSGTNKFLTQDYNASATGVATVQTFTASGTWTKPAKLKYIIIEMVGGGGGGGGEGSTGGGGAGYAKKLIAASTLGATETVTIGTAGSGSTGSPTAGGSSSFTVTSGSTITANGGVVTTGAGGTATNGDINITGQSGSSGSSSDAIAGQGGNSILGLGGASKSGNPGSSSGGADGNAATGYGAGGGAARPGSDGVFTGGAGSAGIVIVTEYYS